MIFYHSPAKNVSICGDFLEFLFHREEVEKKPQSCDASLSWGLNGMFPSYK